MEIDAFLPVRIVLLLNVYVLFLAVSVIISCYFCNLDSQVFHLRILFFARPYKDFSSWLAVFFFQVFPLT